MSMASPVSLKQVRGRMARKMLWFLMPLSLLPLIFLGGWAYLNRRELFSAQPNNSLIYALIALFIALSLTGAAFWLVLKKLVQPIGELASSMQLFMEGNWEQRANFNSKDEIGVMAYTFNQIASETSELYRLAMKKDTQPTADDCEKIFTKITQIANAASFSNELLRRSLEVIGQKFQCDHGLVYLLVRNPLMHAHSSVLQMSTSLIARQENFLEKKYSEATIDISTPAPADSRLTLLARAVSTKLPQVIRVQDEVNVFEAVIPITSGNQVWGIIDLFSIVGNTTDGNGDKNEQPFSPKSIVRLQTIAQILGLALERLYQQSRSRHEALLDARLPASKDSSESDETDLLEGANHLIAQSTGIDEVLANAGLAFQKIPYPSAILLADEVAEESVLRIAQYWFGALQPPEQPLGVDILISATAMQPYFLSQKPVLVADLRTSPLPKALLDRPHRLGCDSAAFLPVLREEKLATILVLGRSTVKHNIDTGKLSNPLTLEMLGPYINLIELVTTTIEKLGAQQGTQRKLAELELLWNISQTISIETDLRSILHILHRQLERVTGKLSSFAVALYDQVSNTIRIPYMFEEGQFLDITPFPLGEGLSSIVIRTRRPLLLVEDVEKKSLELGAKTVGASAKSWLGVPLLFGGEAIGLIIVQDIHQERRFNEEDERLLTTLAAQVAVVVRNARLLETSRLQARQERNLNEISAQIRRAVDIPSILKTTTEELGKALGAYRAQIEITAGTGTTHHESSDIQPTNGKETAL